MKYGMPSLLELEGLEENVVLAQRLHLDFVEINANVPEFQVDAMDPETLLRLTRETGIRFTIHLDEFMSITDPNPTISEAYIDSVIRSVEFAKKAGITSLTLHLINGVVFTLPHKKVYVYEKYRDYYLSRMVVFRDRVTQAIGTAPISVNIENVAGFEPYMREAIELLLVSPVFGLTYDCGHNHRYHRKDWDFIQKNRDRIRHMHVHDCLGQADHQPFGEGELDIPAELKFTAQTASMAVIEVKTVSALTQTVQTLNEYKQKKMI